MDKLQRPRFRRLRQFVLLDLFTPASALALLAGALGVQALSALPPRWIEAALGVAGLCVAGVRGRWRWLGLALLGAAWTMLRADVALSQRLPHALEGADVVVTGAIVGLPRVQDDSTRFDFAVDTSAQAGAAMALSGVLRLSWQHAAEVPPCSHWRLHLRLKRPRGMIDPGAFDFERYALEQGITATGYVREDPDNVDTGRDAVCVDRLRAQIGEEIESALGPGAQRQSAAGTCIRRSACDG